MYPVLGVEIAEFLLSQGFEVQCSADFPFDTYSDTQGHVVCIDNACEKGLIGITYGGEYGEQVEAHSLEEVKIYVAYKE